jgi:hypothetical protein
VKLVAQTKLFQPLLIHWVRNPQFLNSDRGHGVPKLMNPENKVPGATDEEDIGFQVSISSQYSTLFDCILLGQVHELRTDIYNIKLNICSQLKLETGQVALATPLAIKNWNTLNKTTLATGLLGLLYLANQRKFVPS